MSQISPMTTTDPTATLIVIVREYEYLLANPNEISRERRNRLGTPGAIREVRADLGVAREILATRAAAAFDEFSR